MASAGLRHPQVDVDLDVVIGQIEHTGQYQLDASDQSKLRPHKKIFAEWPEQPPDNHLQIFVRLPSGLGSPNVVYDGRECCMRLFALADI